MRAFGLHLRLQDSFIALAQKAQSQALPIFQCFLIGQETQEPVRISDQDMELFKRDYRAHFSRLYLHASYWVNLSTVRHSHQRVFFKEREIAQMLSFTHMILHPGAATGGSTKKDGIDALAIFLNKVCAQEHPIKLVLENTTHGGLSVGGDFKDFAYLLQKLDFPDRIFFCVDTAHAYSYGYDITTGAGRQDFMNELETTIGFERIVLLHLNDTREQLGSRIDRHATLGLGHIGTHALQAFVTEPRLQHADIILELPIMPEEQELEILHTIKTWQ